MKKFHIEQVESNIFDFVKIYKQEKSFSVVE